MILFNREVESHNINTLIDAIRLNNGDEKYEIMVEACGCGSVRAQRTSYGVIFIIPRVIDYLERQSSSKNTEVHKERAQ